MAESDRAERDLNARWAATWREAGPALAAQKKNELRRMTAAEGLAAADALLLLADPSRLPRRRLETSGLVEQQARFLRNKRTA